MNKKTIHVLCGFLFLPALVILFTLPLPGQNRGFVPPPPKPTTGKGALVVFADLTLFAEITEPENCTMRNRFKRGEGVGWRITAVDGESGNPETSSNVVVHLTYMGKTIDIPAEPRMLGGPKPYYPNIWTAKWVVPKDAATGILRYTVTAKDKYGRTGTWTPFPYATSLLTIVQ
jgi:hypothetical protein